MAKKNYKAITLLLFTVLANALSANVFAAYLVVNGTVAKIANTSDNQQHFALWVNGGSGNLCAGTWIVFRQSDAPDADTFKRAYATALLAYTTGVPVSVHNYSGNNCIGASYIELSTP